MMYQHLMSNNATWTIIDRGEPGSYFAIWDLVDYMGQGVVLQNQCKLLREVWEGMALSKSLYRENDLLKTLMKDYSSKKNIADFVEALIVCLVPKNVYGFFTASLAEQFEAVVRAAASCQSAMRSNDPLAFIRVGFEVLSDEDPENSAATFELVPECPAYHQAMSFFLSASDKDWDEFCYYSLTYKSSILEKGNVYY